MPLSSDEISVLENLAWPLPRHARSQFIESVTSALEAFPVHDVGLAHRLGREEQARLLGPPTRSTPQLLSDRKLASVR
jgi:hypothetical protein